MLLVFVWDYIRAFSHFRLLRRSFKEAKILSLSRKDICPFSVRISFWRIKTCLASSTVANSPCFEAVELQVPLVERDKPLNREQLFDSSTFPWNQNARMTLKKKNHSDHLKKKKQAAVLSSSGSVLEVNQWHCFDVASHIKWLDGFEVGGLCFSILQWVTC